MPKSPRNQIWGDTDMRLIGAMIVGGLLLASCGPRLTRVSADKCWSLDYSDRVKGTAILTTEEGHECVECGARVSGPDCESYGVTTGNDAVSNSFRRIMQSSPHDRFGGIQEMVYLSGDVIHNKRTGESTIIAKELRRVDKASD